METIILKKFKERKHSVRFSTDDKTAAVRDIYVLKKSPLSKKKEVTMTLE